MGNLLKKNILHRPAIVVGDTLLDLVSWNVLPCFIGIVRCYRNAKLFSQFGLRQSLLIPEITQVFRYIGVVQGITPFLLWFINFTYNIYPFSMGVNTFFPFFMDI